MNLDHRKREIMYKCWETRLPERGGGRAGGECRKKRSQKKNPYQRISSLTPRRFSLTYQRTAVIFKFIPPRGSTTPFAGFYVSRLRHGRNTI